MHLYPDSDDYQTPEEEAREYLDANPGMELSLWSSWVGTCCDWDKAPHPSHAEWQALRASFYPGKTPAQSYEELKMAREKQAAAQQGAAGH